MKRLTTNDFITKAKLIHGDRYDYSLSNYAGNKNNLKIICKEHGDFWQSPSNHYAGKGCPRCSGRLNGDSVEFIRMAKLIHGNKYDYSNVNYVSSKAKILIKCSIHGVFPQTPAHHLNDTGCPKCNGKFRLSNNDFVKKAESVHGKTYDYSKIVYVSANKPVEIVCSVHGSFWQTYSNHTDKRHGCPYCYGNAPKTTGQFISEANEIHLGKYDYSNSVYRNLKSKIAIICHIHGEFNQSAITHLKGSGCKACAKYGYKINLPAILYLFKINETTLGFGITNDFKTRHNKHKSTFKKHGATYELLATYECSGHQALAIENHLKQTYEIIDTGIEGFRKEATPIGNLSNILEDIKKLLDTV